MIAIAVSAAEGGRLRTERPAISSWCQANLLSVPLALFGHEEQFKNIRPKMALLSA
jgi:hypothetical protein